MLIYKLLLYRVGGAVLTAVQFVASMEITCSKVNLIPIAKHCMRLGLQCADNDTPTTTGVNIEFYTVYMFLECVFSFSFCPICSPEFRLRLDLINLYYGYTS